MNGGLGARPVDDVPVGGVVLTLYVVGGSGPSATAVRNLRRLTERLDPPPETRVVDLAERHDVAVADGIVVTPTLVRESPPPPRRVIGDLSDLDAVRAALDLPDQVTGHHDG